MIIFDSEEYQNNLSTPKPQFSALKQYVEGCLVVFYIFCFNILIDGPLLADNPNCS